MLSNLPASKGIPAFQVSEERRPGMACRRTCRMDVAFRVSWPGQLIDYTTMTCWNLMAVMRAKLRTSRLATRVDSADGTSHRTHTRGRFSRTSTTSGTSPHGLSAADSADGTTRPLASRVRYRLTGGGGVLFSSVRRRARRQKSTPSQTQTRRDWFDTIEEGE